VGGVSPSHKGSMAFHGMFFFIARHFVSILTRDVDIEILSVRLSVHNAPVLDDENGLTYRHSFFTIR